MSRRKYTPEQTISKLREVKVTLAQGATVPLAARGIGVTDQAYYHWRREYGGLTVEQAKRLKELEKENLRPRCATSDLTLDKLTLKEAAEGNF
jgi:putative transposase